MPCRRRWWFRLCSLIYSSILRSSARRRSVPLLGRLFQAHADANRLGRSFGEHRPPGLGFLFAILFLWQFPHFLAIALMYRDDYSRAGYHMLPDFDRGRAL